jgi:hypothetical protein
MSFCIPKSKKLPPGSWAPIWHKTCGSPVFLWQFHTKPFKKLEGIPVKAQRRRIDVAHEPVCQCVAQGHLSLEMAVLDPPHHAHLFFHRKIFCTTPCHMCHSLSLVHTLHSFSDEFKPHYGLQLAKNGSLCESCTWRQLSLMWGYRNLCHAMTSASIQRVIMSRSSLRM